MSFNVIATVPFERKLKRLAKKYKSLKTDLLTIVNESRQLHYNFNIVSKYSLFQPAAFLLAAIPTFKVDSAFSKLSATRLTIDKFSAELSVRVLLASSLKLTSKIQWSFVSTHQWALTQAFIFSAVISKLLIL